MRKLQSSFIKKTSLCILITILAACASLSVVAQSDSSWLDLGLIKLKKNFTQTISIKGSSLEKMPFANLSDAINVWLYGVYSNPSTLIYVIDGNILMDVNSYSIHDIDEIIFIQNALVEINGALGQQQLVLITTKKTKAAKSFTFTAQSGIVNRDFSTIYPREGLHSNTNFYHQYYAGSNLNINKTSFGISASYLRDVEPSVKADSIQTTTPFNLNRLLLNSYFKIKLNNKNEINFSINYATEKIDSAQSYYVTDPYFSTTFFNNANAYQQQHLLATSASWNSQLIRNLKNELQVSYLTSSYNPNSSSIDSSSQNTFGEGHYLKYGNETTHYFFAKNNTTYIFKAGYWNIEPSFNVSFLYSKISDSIFTEDYYNSLSYSVNELSASTKFNLFSFIPSVNIYYKDAFDIQAGFLADKISNSSFKKDFPFATTSIDLLKLFHSSGKSSIKLFGSFAQQSYYIPGPYSLIDLSTANNFFEMYQLLGGYGFGNGNQYSSPIISYNNTNPDLKIWQAGTTIYLFNNRLQINYNFERRGYTPIALIPIPTGTNYASNIIEYPQFRAYTNNLGFTATILEKQFINWLSGITVTTINTKTDAYLPAEPLNNTGDYNVPVSWTGGWVNNFRYKNFSIGINMLFHFNETTFNSQGKSVKTNSLLAQNIYAAYLLYTRKLKNIEIFIDSRNTFNNSNSDISDGRRYFTIGSKIVI